MWTEDTVNTAGEICLPVKAGDQPAYPIWLEESFENLPKRMAQLDIQKRRLCLVTDSNVMTLYGREVEELLRPHCRDISVCVIPAGEAHKNLGEIQKIYEHLIQHSLDRQDILVALGGGVTGDMTGYAAATYLRGIRFVQIPTTLLAQVDSSIGGKTGVDFEQYKNMVGAFHQPSLVYMNLSVLKTLSAEQFSCGMGEILKHGLIRSASYFDWVLCHREKILQRSLPELVHMVEESCKIKRQVVEADPTEKGERALLNFGHTVGHAIEKLKNFSMLHGQCVALGCLAAARISQARGFLSDKEVEQIRSACQAFDLPVSLEGLSSRDILDATRHDKKMASGQIRFILLRSVGEAFIDDTVTDQEMLAAIDSLSETQNC